MIVRKLGGRTHLLPKPNYVMYKIYDETRTQPYDQKRAKEFIGRLPTPPGVNRDEFCNEIIKRDRAMWQEIDGASFERPIMCYFMVARNGEIKFEFDSSHQYSLDELKTITTKARRAARRIKWAA